MVSRMVHGYKNLKKQIVDSLFMFIVLSLDAFPATLERTNSETSIINSIEELSQGYDFIINQVGTRE